MKRGLLVLCICITLLTSCAVEQASPLAATSPLATATVRPTPVITPTPAPTPTPVPTPVTVTLGAVGDIMVVPKHLTAALDEETGEYDFSFCFPAMSGMFNAVDVMCGNLEGTLPGPDVDRYSSRQTGGYGKMRFGAPDAFAQTLKDAGFDFLTTGNNHAGDYGAAGIVRTIDALDAYGFKHAGTYKSAEARKTPCIMDVKGVRIGFVAVTTCYNTSPGITDDERNEMLARTQFMDLVMADIAVCKAAGADFIIMFPHWDYEYQTVTAGGTRNYARQFLEAGVDAIIGSHPHVVQPMRYETVTRPDGTEYTGLVAYSLGNFFTSELFNTSCGLYVQLEITKDIEGRVSLSGASYMPTYCMDRYIGEVQYHQVVPALADTSGLKAYAGALGVQEQRVVLKARNRVMEICGTDVVPLMEDACWIS